MKSPIIHLMSWLCAALTLPLSAQVRESWIARHTISAMGVNQAVAITVDKDGNLIVGGHGTSTNGDSDYVGLKYSPAGTLLWNTRFGSDSNETVRGMAVDQAGSVVLTGTGNTVKWNAGGMEEWHAEYGGRALAVDPSGDVYLTGHRESSFSTIKLHRDAGTNLWERTHVLIPGHRDLAQVISVDGKSNVFVGGEVICYWEPRAAYAGRCIISYNADGVVRWQTPLPQSECVYSSVKMIGIGLDETGAVYEVAEVFPGGVEVTGYNSSGVHQWMAHSSYAFQGLRAAYVDKEGFVYLTGISVDIHTRPIALAKAV